MSKKFSTILLGLIILIAFVLRFYNLSSNPPSLTWDEAAWGYNAYSLGIDGKDEFGKFLPLDFIESFGDFKPPVYAYLSVIPVAVFGLNEFSTRFASAFFGTLTVFLTYLLTCRIFISSKLSREAGSRYAGEIIALISAGILAISPWHILLSRAAFEANVATFFIVLGVLLFLSAKKKKWLLILSAISFVLSMYTFNTARIVTPLLVLGMAFAFRKELYKYFRKEVIIASLVGVIISIPLFLFLLTPQAKLRYQEVNIFSDPKVVQTSNQKIENDNNSILSKILNNRRVGYAISYVNHYFDNLTPDFLFIKGDGNPKFSIQDVGQLYIFEIPLVVAGLLFLFRKREGLWWLIPYWILVGIIPAATARETPHALRIATTLPMFQILSAYGAYYLMIGIFNLKFEILNLKLKYLTLLLFGLFCIFNFAYFLHNYFIFYPKEFSAEWQYGYREAINYVKENNTKYENVIVTEDLGRPYIYALFYEKYSPEKFRQEAKIDREALGFVHVRRFGKYKFVKNVAGANNSSQNNLYIDTAGKLPDGANVVAEFKRLNGEQELVAYVL